MNTHYKNAEIPSFSEALLRAIKHPNKIIIICVEYFLNRFIIEEFNTIRENDNQHDGRYRLNCWEKKRFRTIFGEITLNYPRLKKGNNYTPKAFEFAQKMEDQFKSLLTKLFVLGCSVRKIAQAFTEIGVPLSKTMVDVICKEGQNSGDKDYLQRDLNFQDYLCLQVDTMYITVRVSDLPHAKYKTLGLARAFGLNVDTCCWEALGAQILPGESTLGYEILFENLKRRRIGNVFVVVSDFHKSFNTSIPSCFPESERQGCVFHKEKLSFAHFVKELAEIKGTDPEDLSANIANKITIVKLYDCFYRDTLNFKTTSMLADKLMSHLNFSEELKEEFFNHFAETLTYLHFPKSLWKMLSNTNQAERTNERVRRRTKVICALPNEDSLNRLVCSLCLDEAKRWNINTKCSRKDMKKAIVIHNELVEQAYKQVEEVCSSYYRFRKSSLKNYNFDYLWCNFFSIPVIVGVRKITIGLFTVHGVKEGTPKPTLLYIAPVRNHNPEEYQAAACNLIKRGINPDRVKLIVNSTFLTSDYEGFTKCFPNSQLFTDSTFYLKRLELLTPESFQAELTEKFKELYSDKGYKKVPKKITKFETFIKNLNLEDDQNYFKEIKSSLEQDLRTIQSLKKENRFISESYEIPSHWIYKQKVIIKKDMDVEKAIEELITSLTRKKYKSAS